MAWRSSGLNNDDMVDNLKRFGVIHSDSVEQGFRAVDRRFFVPQDRQDMAHADQPLKEGNIHISAPHIYGSVVEALDITPHSSLSFLNIGSGTGYLSCIVAEIMGPTASCYGIEIYPDVVEHCQVATQRWKASRPPTHPPVSYMEFLHGNGLHIETDHGECLVGFDRIYIGASLERRSLQQLANLLRPGGVLVGPVDDELMKVIRISTSLSGESTPRRSPPRSIRGRAPALSSDYTQQVLSGVRFAPLLTHPQIPTSIQSRVWNPSVHQSYPDSFRRACKQILLCASSAEIQPPPQVTTNHINAASKLPRALWMEILSFTHRDWFELPRSGEDFLRQRLLEEQAASHRAQEARLQAEARLHLIERERDIYRLMAFRLRSRLQSVVAERGAVGQAEDDILASVEEIAQVASAVSINEPLLLSLGGLSAIMRRLQDDSEDEDDDDDDDEDQQHGQSSDDEEDQDVSADMETEVDEEVTNMDDSQESESMAISSSASLPGRPQARTISVSSDDL